MGAQANRDDPSGLDADGRFRHLFSAIDEGYCLCEIVLDDDGAPVDYVFLEVNPLFEQMTGLVGATGRSARSLVPDLEQSWVDVYARAALGGERIRFQQASEAMGRWFDVFTMPMPPQGRFAIVFKDETARHQAEIALRESEGRLRTQAAREHATSQRLQKALLPSALVEHPMLPVRAVYRAASSDDDVGGDWYDTFAWPGGEVGIMVGDVVGHNLEAAVAMGSLRAGVAALARRLGPDPVELVAALEECVTAPGGADLVTAVAAVVDPSAGRLTYCSAGHPPGVVVGPGGEIVWLDGAQTPPLGAARPRARTGATLALRPGSTILLYSDGLIERRGEVIDAGLHRLAGVATAIADTDLDDVCSRVTSGALEGSEPEDDVVVVAARLQA